MARDVEVVVVGGGIAGLAAGHALARQGRDVVVVERFRLGHTRGSSHGATRIFRLAYPEPRWVRLAQEALVGWRELEAERGAELVSLVGLVELVRDLSLSSQHALASCGVESRVLDTVEAKSAFHVSVRMDSSPCSSQKRASSTPNARTPLSPPGRGCARTCK